MKHYFILVLILVFGTSCKKQRIEKIEDSWKLVKVSKVREVTHHEIWQFEDDRMLIIQYPVETNLPDTICDGTYNIKVGLSKTFINTSGLSDERYNGQWRVIKVNSDILILFKKDTYWLYREFVRSS
jgi:hypothetical protein